MSQIDAFETSGSSPGDDIDWDAVEEQRIADQWEAAQAAQEAAEEAEFGTPLDDDIWMQWDDEAGDFKVFTDADFGFDEPEEERPKYSRAAYETFLASQVTPLGDVINMGDPEWFIDGLIPWATLNVLYGKHGTKKTVLMHDWMLCAAYGIPWHGHDIVQGKVLFVAAEGFGGTPKRLRAWMAAHDITEPPGKGKDAQFLMIPRAINLLKLTADHVDHWRQLVAAMEIDYIVFDTLHRNAGGMEENGSKDIGTIYDNAQTIAGDRAAVWFVHHDSRSGSAGGRGSTAISDDADNSIELKASGKLESTLRSEKLKDAEDIDGIKLNLAVHGEGAGSALYIDSIGTLTADEVAKTKGPSAEDRAIEAIRSHGLDINVGQVLTSQALKAMDLGYNFGPRTVGRALAHLRSVESLDIQLIDGWDD